MLSVTLPVVARHLHRLPVIIVLKLLVFHTSQRNFFTMENNPPSIGTTVVTAFTINNNNNNSNKMRKHLNSDSDANTNNSKEKLLYNVENSGWSSSEWNWGSSIGTGHDCAKICRQKFANQRVRQELVTQLLNSGKDDDGIQTSFTEDNRRFPTTINDSRTTSCQQNIDFEEIKLVLALVWQRGRWDGSDGGPGGYSEILHHMVEAVRYEIGTDEEISRRFVHDMQSRFQLLSITQRQFHGSMSTLDDGDLSEEDIFLQRNICAGLVLQAMDFIEKGC